MIVSLAINDVDPNWRIGCVILFSCDAVLGFIELIAKKKKKILRVPKEKTATNRIQGTICIFLFFSTYCEALAFATLLCM